MYGKIFTPCSVQNDIYTAMRDDVVLRSILDKDSEWGPYFQEDIRSIEEVPKELKYPHVTMVNENEEIKITDTPLTEF